MRRLPSLYLGPELAYNHRDVARVVDRADMWTSVIQRSAERATYTLTPCSFNGAVGLYARELFERSAFRRRLRRRGVAFDDVPYVTFETDGTFFSDTFGKFTPRFMFLGSAGLEDPAEIVTTKGAELAFVVVTYRLGTIGRDELGRLIGAVKDVRALSADLPEALLEELAVV